MIDYGIQPIHLPGPYLVQQGDTLYFPDSLVTNADLIRRKWLDNDFAGITYSLSWKSGPLQTSVGGSWNIYVGRHFGRVIWSEIAMAAPPDLEWYRSKAQKQDFNIYGKANYDLSRVFSLFADLQLRRINYGIDGIDDDSRDITQDHNFTFFNPKAGINATIDENNAAYLSFGIANREPNRDNFVDADLSETAPRPETLYDFEIGHKYQSTHVLLSSNLYWMLYNDQLVLTGAINDVGAPVMVNVPESYRLGLEVSGKIEFTDKLNWGLSATISRNKIRKFTEYVDNWDTWSQESFEHQNTDLSFSPSLILNSDVQLKPLKNLSIHFISKYVGKQYLDNTQDESRKLDAYLINDLRFSYSFFPAFLKELRINAFINNIFNHEYESNAWIYRYMEANEMKVLDGYYPQAGINFMAGMSLKF
ncbi:MAG: TonB-dependent receptor [Bacteroidales bacterium]|nr:TonB-dependent receptor [Bacteroidales bacterium]